MSVDLKAGGLQMRGRLTGEGERRLLTYKEMARALNVSERTVWQWAQEGLIATVPMGPKLVRFHPDEKARVMREGVSCRLADRA